MLKVLVVLTGGTIGSKISSHTMDVNAAAAYRLIQIYQEKFGNETKFEVIQPFNILSENFTPKYWGKLCQSLFEIDYNCYDGVIVTHGTDTLSYTSAMLGLLFRHVPIPVVLVSSNYPLEHPKSNGIANFRSAICFVAAKKVKGVYSIFQNDLGENMIYLATRITEADSYCDQFVCYGGEEFGKIDNEELRLNRHFQNPSVEELNEVKSQIIEKGIQFDNKVLVIKPYPGLDYRFFHFETKPKVILHCLYHSATACVMEEEYSFIEFIKRCHKEEIDFYVASFKESGRALYVTSKEILAAGAVPLINISTEAAYAKLSIAYNQIKMEPKEFMKENIYFECLPAK